MYIVLLVSILFFQKIVIWKLPIIKIILYIGNDCIQVMQVKTVLILISEKKSRHLKNFEKNIPEGTTIEYLYEIIHYAWNKWW